MPEDLRNYQQQASQAAKPGGKKPAKPTTRPLSGAARSSFEETTFGMNSGAGPNASRDVAKPEAKQRPPMSDRTRRELGR